MNFIKNLLKYIVKFIPFKLLFLKFLAQLSPKCKTRWIFRFASYISSMLNQKIFIKTNMGMDIKNLYSYPLNQTFIVFGRPDYYVGERGPLALANILVLKSDCFVDIGAHFGYFSFYIQNLSSKSNQIHLFEPVPDLFEVIEKNVKNNNFSNINLNRNAVGSKNGHVKFYKNISCPLMGSLNPEFAEGARLEEIEVESIRFSEYVIKNKLKNILVKVDIEGAEQDFIDGARECMDKVSYLIIEVLGEASRNGFVKRVIDEFKLNAYYINDFNLMHSADGSYKYIAPEYNWFFCNKNPSQLKETLNSNLISVYCDGVKI